MSIEEDIDAFEQLVLEERHLQDRIKVLELRGHETKQLRETLSEISKRKGDCRSSIISWARS